MTDFYYYCFSFEEISDTCVPKGSAVQVVLTSGVRFLLYSHRANQIHAMIEKYCLDNDKVGKEFYYFVWLHNGDGIVTADESGLDKQSVLFNIQVSSSDLGQEMLSLLMSYGSVSLLECAVTTSFHFLPTHHS
jgi:hypothetical protein